MTRYLMHRQWKIQSQSFLDRDHSLRDLLLSTRNIPREEARDFFEPSLDHIHDPLAFRDMALAVEVISQVKRNHGSILIFGDYDCDGLTSTALLLRFFRRWGVAADYLLPSRLGSGYGLSTDLVNAIVQKHPDLVITVDNGSSSPNEIACLMEAGIPVIVTDHHKLSAAPPPALCFLNPQYAQDTYPFPDLAGVGVAWQLARACAQAFRSEAATVEAVETEEFDLHEGLVLAALGTIADSMPLVGDNRAIVHLGLEAFSEHAPLGLKLLAKNLGLQGKPKAEFLSFSLATRLNAACRLDDLDAAMTLLMSQDASELAAAVEDLEQLNAARRKLEADMVRAAVAQVDAQTSEQKNHIILVKDSSWHPGVIGIVASRLAEKYDKPALVFCEVDGELRGSGRSVHDFNLHQALLQVESYCLSAGGHQAAVGVSLEPAAFDAFSQALREALAKSPENSDIQVESALTILPHDEINDQLLDLFMDFEPFGEGNPKPVFVVQDLLIDRLRLVGAKKEHLSLNLRLSDGQRVAGIAFRQGKFSRLLAVGDHLDILTEIDEHIWQGQRSLQFNILDMKVLPSGGTLVTTWEKLNQAWLEGESLDNLSAWQDQDATTPGTFRDKTELNLSVPAIQAFWQALTSLLREGDVVCHPLLLTRALSRMSGEEFSGFASARCLEILDEAGIINLQKRNPDCWIVAPGSPSGRPKLSQQPTWQRLEREGGITS